MNAIDEKLIRKAVQMLQTAGCSFAVIDHDGIKYGELNVIPPKKRADSTLPFGSQTQHIAKYITLFKVGEKISVPGLEGINLNQLQSAIGNFINRNYGATRSQYMTAQNKELNCIEVAFLANCDEEQNEVEQE